MEISRLRVSDMLSDLNHGRYKALCLISEHLNPPSRELRLDAIIQDVSDEDLKWVSERLHFYVLKLLEESDYDPAHDDFEHIGLTD
jgi:hypothetical protein